MPVFRPHKRRDLFRLAAAGLGLTLAEGLQGLGWSEAATANGPLLMVAQLTNPLDLDPWGSLIVNETDIMGHFLDPLTVLDRQSKVVPVIASDWKMISPT